MKGLPPLPNQNLFAGSKLDENNNTSTSRHHLSHPATSPLPSSTTITGNGIPIWKAQAYIAIFEDALDQLSVLSDITPEAMKTDNKILAEKITKILLEQRDLQEQYQVLLNEQEHARTLSNKTRLKENQTELSEITNQLQMTTQTLARLLKTHPSVAQNILKIQQERSSVQALFGRTIRELREGRFDSLMQTVEEEYKRRNTLQNTINRENDAADMLKDLQRELANEKKLIQDEIQDRTQVIQQLKDTIQEINAMTASEQKYVKKEVKAHESSVKLQCTQKETLLREEKALLMAKLDQEHRVHDKIVEFLGRQREALEKEIQHWMTKYEDDTEAKALELENLKQKRSQDNDKFEELVSAYEKLEKSVDEDRQIKAKEAEDIRRNKQREESAIRIQKWYRRIREKIKENAAKTSAKQGKKGKGGKKGKKK